VGYLNRFNHPKSLIVARHKKLGATTYRSDFDGALLIDFMSGSPSYVKAWRKAHPKYWHDQYL
jgi:competence protein ComEC